MDGNPLVSVVIPTYNRAAIVTGAIDSVISQDYPEKEAVVVDDGSTDSTGEYLKERYSGRIRYIYQDNREKSAARNRGIREAKGEFICMLDSDDVLLPGALSAMADCFRKNPGADAVYGLSIRKDKEGKERRTDANRKYPEGDILPFFLKERFINNNSFMIRRELMLRYGMYREELTNHEDYEMLLRLASKLKFYFCGSFTCMVRRSGQSAKDNYNKIIGQGVLAMDCLFSAPDLSPALVRLKDTLYAKEYLDLAAASYHLGHYGLFRQYFRKAISRDLFTSMRLRFFRRYIVSLVKY